MRDTQEAWRGATQRLNKRKTNVIKIKILVWLEERRRAAPQSRALSLAYLIRRSAEYAYEEWGQAHVFTL